ncbi:aminopeptidase [Pyrococcus furiosus DSM 3638]|uniref:Aminopeptidase n=3 Tax=Pyrococcus furiosus TaxID=2261 RepID=A0A5C0XRW0_PYRFU|nr:MULTISPECIES: P1 family peptidase [Pyrococcus]AAL82048.1 d-aminopeptidase [Pyrococcus furiosus DSM 3638]AFN04716.1 d-aminopeptidase [Pyrococcus furiosus COM1]MDK2870412.1 D-aminopeptidase [Pyrococcus sp.]QEK79519.1 aminopeptidase [Pyrococcus furiosus DSM 3638]
MKAPDLGIRIGVFEHGKRNSISDVKGVKVGHVTLIKGRGKLIPGKGPVRTGVTAILPHDGNIYKEKVLAGAFVMNGYSKPVGLVQLWELGTIETPIILTNTLSIGTAIDGLLDYVLRENEDIGVTTGSVNPLVLECNDSYLNDIRGRHVKREHVVEAIESASKDFEEGAVGAGTGMSAFEFKGGIGSSSRIVEVEGKKYTVGALVLSNFGKREDLTIAGVPVGLELKDWPGRGGSGKGSIIMIVATDAPLTARQLNRLAKRAVVGLARTGGYAYNGSGDVVVAFSTANKIKHYEKQEISIRALPDSVLSPIFKATAEAVEEAIINSLLQAKTMDGRDNHIRYALPKEELVRIMKKYGRIEE